MQVCLSICVSLASTASLAARTGRPHTRTPPPNRPIAQRACGKTHYMALTAVTCTCGNCCLKQLSFPIGHSLLAINQIASSIWWCPKIDDSLSDGYKGTTKGNYHEKGSPVSGHTHLECKSPYQLLCCNETNESLPTCFGRLMQVE